MLMLMLLLRFTHQDSSEDRADRSSLSLAIAVPLPMSPPTCPPLMSPPTCPPPVSPLDGADTTSKIFSVSCSTKCFCVHLKGHVLMLMLTRYGRSSEGTLFSSLQQLQILEFILNDEDERVMGPQVRWLFSHCCALLREATQNAFWIHSMSQLMSSVTCGISYHKPADLKCRRTVHCFLTSRSSTEALRADWLMVSCCGMSHRRSWC